MEACDFLLDCIQCDFVTVVSSMIKLCPMSVAQKILRGDVLWEGMVNLVRVPIAGKCQGMDCDAKTRKITWYHHGQAAKISGRLPPTTQSFTSPLSTSSSKFPPEKSRKMLYVSRKYVLVNTMWLKNRTVRSINSVNNNWSTPFLLKTTFKRLFAYLLHLLLWLFKECRWQAIAMNYWNIS